MSLYRISKNQIFSKIPTFKILKLRQLKIIFDGTCFKFLYNHYLWVPFHYFHLVLIIIVFVLDGLSFQLCKPRQRFEPLVGLHSDRCYLVIFITNSIFDMQYHLVLTFVHLSYYRQKKGYFGNNFTMQFLSGRPYRN